jgi:hypothetical protein
VRYNNSGVRITLEIADYLIEKLFRDVLENIGINNEIEFVSRLCADAFDGWVILGANNKSRGIEAIGHPPFPAAIVQRCFEPAVLDNQFDIFIMPKSCPVAGLGTVHLAVGVDVHNSETLGYAASALTRQVAK